MNDLLPTLMQRAWTQRYRQPREVVEAGECLEQAAAGAPTPTAWAWLHQAWGWRFRGDQARADVLRERAAAAFAAAGDTSGLAAARVMQAHGLWQTQRPAEALALIDQDPIAPPREALERQVAHATRASVVADLGRWDDSLRERYAAVHAARSTGEPAALGHALGLLGGLQADYDNLDDALRLTTEAEQACATAGATQAGIVASMNRLNALVALGLHDEAVRLTDRMLAQAAQILPMQQEQAHIQFAWALVRAGDPDRAQALLDRSVALRRLGHLLEWTLTQAEIWNAQGRHAEARRLCEDWLAQQPAGINKVSPAEQLRLRQAAAIASEAQGDLAATVAHQREGQRLYEVMVGRSARARRLTLEIEFELERERRERDEAERRRQAAEAERLRLDELNRALEAASLAKTRFLAAASHDLRQPVHALALQVAALRAHLDTPVQQDMAARIDRCVGALTGMFNTLLDLSRIDAGVLEPELRPVALPTLLARLVEEQWPEAERQGLRLALRLPPGAATVPPTALSDPALLERALRNLLVNALKYTRRGGVLLSLRPHHRGRPRAGWRIEVWDTGIGIALADQRRVFDEFYQVAANAPDADAATPWPREAGLGLGLAIVQRLARLLGHGLDLRSVPGRGTRIGLTLPGCEATASGEPQVAPAQARLALRLVVVEDDADVRAALRSLLVQWGCRVADGTSADEAWAALGGEALDAVLADLRLPGGRDGIGEVARLRALAGRVLPALIITGDTAPAHLRALKASGLPWLAKPVPIAQLTHWLESVAHRTTHAPADT